MSEDQKPQDPVTENQCILMGKPVKAFAYQNHEAHIIVHTTSMQDPKVIQVLGQSPQAQALQAAMQAHINEHLGFGYRVEIEKQLGMNLPPQKDASGEDINMDPEVEARLAPMLAQAAQRLLQMNQAQAQQQQAQQQAQDPIVQMQQAELQIKQQDLQRKAQKDKMDAQLKAAQIQNDKARVDNQAKSEGVRIGLKAEQDRKNLESQQTLESIRLGSEAQARQNDLRERIAAHVSNVHKGK
jgi:multidrug efflux pump subunit AcrA (membrane-fusion protein)